MAADQESGAGHDHRQHDRRGEEHARDRRRDEVLHELVRGLHSAVRPLEARLADDARHHRHGGVVVDRLTDPPHEDRAVQPPDREALRRDHERDRGCREHPHPVRDRHRDPAVDPVDDHAGQHAEQQPRHEHERRDAGDEQRIVGERRRDERHRGAAEPVREVAAGRRGPQAVEARAHRGFAGAGRGALGGGLGGARHRRILRSVGTVAGKDQPRRLARSNLHRRRR